MTMPVVKIAASQVEVGMYCAEVDEDLTIEEMDQEAMDWQRVVKVQRFGWCGQVEITFAYHDQKNGTYPYVSTGTNDQLLYVEADEQGRPLVAHEDDWACEMD